MRTKKYIKNRITTALSLIEAANTILSKLQDDLMREDSNDDALFDLMLDVKNDNYDNAEHVMKDLAELGYLKDMPEESENRNERPPVTVGLTCDTYLNIKVPVDGGVLEAFESESDFGIYQVGIVYDCNDNVNSAVFDLTLAEVKKGELAENSSLDPENNKDIDLYVFGDQTTEDYSEKIRLSYDKFKEITDDVA